MHIAPFHEPDKLGRNTPHFTASKDDIVLSSMTYFDNKGLEPALAKDFVRFFPTFVYLIENLVLHEKVILALFLDFSYPAVYGSLKNFLEFIDIPKNERDFIYVSDVNKDNFIYDEGKVKEQRDKPFSKIMMQYVLPFFYVNKFEGKPIIDLQDPDVTSIPFHCLVDHSWSVGNNLNYALPHGIYNDIYESAVNSIAQKYKFTAKEIYERLKDILKDSIDPLSLLGKPVSLNIPPITTIVLDKVDKPSQIGQEILSLRSELAKSHTALKEMRDCAMSKHTTIKDSLETLKNYQNIMDQLSKNRVPNNLKISSWTDLITNLPKDVSDGISTDDFDYRNIVKSLINKPADYLIKKLKLKDFSFFFNIHSQIFNLKETSGLIKKVFGIDLSR